LYNQTARHEKNIIQHIYSFNGNCFVLMQEELFRRRAAVDIHAGKLAANGSAISAGYQ
jgi:hypothetical protein